MRNVPKFSVLSILGLLGATLLMSCASGLLGGSLPPGDKPGTIEIGGRTRTYFIHVPPSYDGKTPLPLVLVLHGATQTPEGVESMSGMSAKADQESFLVAYPHGTGRFERLPTWNSGNCCGYAMQNHVDDVGFLSELIEKLQRGYSIDTKRVYVTGISNGAMMSYRLACELAGKIAAIAPVEGALDADCKPSTPVSVIIFHGTADRLVPFNGGTTRFQIGPARSDNSVAGAVTFWVGHDSCSSTPKHEESSEVHMDFYGNCKGGAEVALYAIQGGRHIWPGVRFSGNSVAATGIMWSFFAKHPKP